MKFFATIVLLCHSIYALPTNLNVTNASHLHLRKTLTSINDFHTAVCRGIKLSWAMQLPSALASQFLIPINSPFDGDLRDDLHHWGYTEVSVQGYLCDFDTTHHLEVAFHELGVNPRSEKRGGPNHCFHVQHQYMDHPLPVREQGYWADGQLYRVCLPRANGVSELMCVDDRRPFLRWYQRRCRHCIPSQQTKCAACCQYILGNYAGSK